MPPEAAVRLRPVDPAVDGLVLAVLATGPEHLRAALRRVTALPALVAALARVVVLDTGRAPSATGMQEDVRLPGGLLRVIRQPGASRPEGLARLLVDAADERGATAVLVLDDVALTDPAVLLEAFATARASAASDVVGLRDPRAVEVGPASWWGAVLPLDAVRALGATLPEAGDVALAELVLRAEAAGFRPRVVPAPGPVPAVTEADRLLLALLHAPTRARTALLRDGLAHDLRLLLGLRFGDLATRRAGIADLLGSRGPAARLRMWVAWPALRRAARNGAALRASADAWALRLLDAEVNRERRPVEREASAERPAGLRFPAWPTSKRGTSAA